MIPSLSNSVSRSQCVAPTFLPAAGVSWPPHPTSPVLAKGHSLRPPPLLSRPSPLLLPPRPGRIPYPPVGPRLCPQTALSPRLLYASARPRTRTTGAGPPTATLDAGGLGYWEEMRGIAYDGIGSDPTPEEGPTGRGGCGFKRPSRMSRSEGRVGAKVGELVRTLARYRYAKTRTGLGDSILDGRHFTHVSHTPTPPPLSRNRQAPNPYRATVAGGGEAKLRGGLWTHVSGGKGR